MNAPRVYLIAGTEIYEENVHKWLKSIGGQECLEHVAGTDPERLIEIAARRCYKSFKPGLNPNVTKVRTNSTAYHKNILTSKHGSVTEHASSTWAIEGVSRVFTHELVRHRVGTAFSQESLRYVRLSDEMFVWIPDEIQNNEYAKQLFLDATEQMKGWQRKLATFFGIENITDFNQKKKLTSAFRRIAPIGLTTGIVVTFTMRALRWVVEHRSSRHAEVEMRLVVDQIAQVASNRWPMLFQDFRRTEVDGIGEWVPENSKI